MKKQFLEKSAAPSRIIPLFVFGLLIYLMMVLITIPRVREYASGMDIPDMMPLAAALFDYLENLGMATMLFWLILIIYLFLLIIKRFKK